MERKQAIFDCLIQESLPMFRSTAYSVLGNAADADDAVQEALIKAWKSYHLFRSKSKLSSWVCRITLNVACDMLRKKKREQAKIQKIQQESAPDNSDSESGQLEQLQSAIAELEEPYRSAITLGVLSNITGEKAAAILECNPNTLYWRISRAKELLRAKLKGM